jgi:predicted DNA-binding transcriptional regulator YafY
MEHRIVEIEYQSLASASPSVRRICPYAVALYQSSLYIIVELADVEDNNRVGAIRHLKLDRFRRATALDEWFTPKQDFDLKRHLRESIGIFAGGGKSRNFKIRLSALAARWIAEDPWHPDQKVRYEKDGSVVLTVPAAHDLEVIPKVLALGAEAELLAPASCRKAMAATVKKLHSVYRT